MKVNYHTHTERCRHAKGSAKEYAVSAQKAGVEILGFSDHGPFPDDILGNRMPYSELGDYLDDVKALKKEYEGKMKIFTGLEIEYFPSYRNYYDKLLSEGMVDYLLLGQHAFLCGKGTVQNVCGLPSSYGAVEYARSVSEAMKTGMFKILAHPDLLFQNPFPLDDYCKKALDMILNAAISTGTILELNSNGFRRGIGIFPEGPRYQYPYDYFWEMVAESEALVINGSDCHDPVQMYDDYVVKGNEYLAKLGITPVEDIFNPELKSSEWVFRSKKTKSIV